MEVIKYMKNKLILILAVILIISMFSGCKKGAVTPTPTPTGTAASPSATPGNYNYAVGKYDKNEQGWPKSKYEYELPLSKTDEKFSLWTVSYTPQYLPEDGYNGLAMYKGIKEKQA
jgi:hypothetical protein